MAAEVIDRESFWPQWLRLGRLLLCLDASWPARGHRRVEISLTFDTNCPAVNIVVQPWWGWLHFQAAWIPKGESK